MDPEFRRIRNRYEDLVVGVLDPEMFRDLLWVLRYAESLHEDLTRYRALPVAVMAACKTPGGDLLQ